MQKIDKIKKRLYYLLILVSSLLFYSFYVVQQPHFPVNFVSYFSDSSSNSRKSNILLPPFKYSFGLGSIGKNFLSNSRKNKSPYININVSRDSFPQNEPSVKISRKNPNSVVAAWRDFRNGTEPAVRRVGYSYSTDGGTTWSASALLPSFSSFYSYNSDPVVCVDTSGNFYISTISISNKKSNTIVTVYKSTNEGKTFEQKFNVTPHPDSINYGDDKSYITCDLVDGSPYKNTLYVVWSSDSESVLSKSTDGGLSWSKRINIVTNGGGYALAPAVGLNGELYIAWLGLINGKSYGLYVSKSKDGGLHFESDFICPIVSTPGVTRFPSIAVDMSESERKGNVYLTWCNKVLVNEDEDVYFCSSTNRGVSWSEPKRVNDDSRNNTRKQFWPWMTVNKYGNIFITFYDCRNTANNNTIESYIARSTDGGNSFQNIPLSSAQSIISYQNSDIRFGDYICIDSWQNKVIPVWTDERRGRYDTEIYSSVINDTVINTANITGNIPSRFKLYQNYTNPFNPVSTIIFDLPVSSFVNLSIYNVLGSEISILVNENLKAGTYRINWNADKFSSGVYICKINFGFNIEVGKLLLVK